MSLPLLAKSIEDIKLIRSNIIMLKMIIENVVQKLCEEDESFAR